ncbi:MAG: S4 domain-containing protein, partial [Nitrospirota bacterium]
MKKITSTIKQEDKRERLDTYVSSKSGLSRSYIQRLLKNGLILVNSQPEKSSYIIRQGDVIKLTIPDEPPLTLIPEDVPLDIVREDGHIIVVNKPPYMVVYPSAG